MNNNLRFNIMAGLGLVVLLLVVIMMTTGTPEKYEGEVGPSTEIVEEEPEFSEEETILKIESPNEDENTFVVEAAVIGAKPVVPRVPEESGVEMKPESVDKSVIDGMIRDKAVELDNKIANAESARMDIENTRKELRELATTAILSNK
jgi:hypothetical protein